MKTQRVYLMNELIFRVPLKITYKWSLNKIYAGVLPWVRTRDKRFILNLVRPLFYGRKIKTFDKPVMIEMQFKSRLDVSNHSYLFKMVEDAMVDLKIIENDSDKFVKEIRQKKQVIFDGIIVYVREYEESE